MTISWVAPPLLTDLTPFVRTRAWRLAAPLRREAPDCRASRPHAHVLAQPRRRVLTARASGRGLAADLATLLPESASAACTGLDMGKVGEGGEDDLAMEGQAR